MPPAPPEHAPAQRTNMLAVLLRFMFGGVLSSLVGSAGVTTSVPEAAAPSAAPGGGVADADEFSAIVSAAFNLG